ncbi:tRNA nucleotidyltransferase (CCA-adding enzyme) [Salsuginibacillus halophilus]|uniref:tRNA nucleotidyltransferase (CCA-adding enzyme) n=1 Tax=Salsuginibacillus halophilus TaxID=517424 RepID=A0A2P8HWC7_9BACI|nr:hypothetical protein [Salsuginibacillus halophilus]PSL50529.1 tRNA nucleotidyltransferase (CCA-adding enzyme) [Salsuginibacillus halophilus]
MDAGARFIIDKLQKAGIEAAVVGGAVRDEVMNQTPKDVDIAAKAEVSSLVDVFPSARRVGRQTESLLVKACGTVYEVTPYKGDGTLKDDLAHRDFTMNAMAILIDGTIYDPFHGKFDIQSRKLACPGACSDRLEEDPLRLLRAFRFQAVYHFQFSRELASAVQKQLPWFDQVAAERVGEEWKKLLSSPYAVAALKQMAHSGVFASLLKQNKRVAFTYYEGVDPSLSLWANWPGIWWSLNCSSQETRRGLKNLARPSQEVQNTVRLIDWVLWREVNDWTAETLYQAGWSLVEAAEHWLRVRTPGAAYDHCELKYMYHKLPIQTRADLPVDGIRLMKLCNRSGGAWIEDVLRSVEKEVLNNRLQLEREAVEAFIQEEWT